MHAYIHGVAVWSCSRAASDTEKQVKEILIFTLFLPSVLACPSSQLTATHAKIVYSLVFSSTPNSWVLVIPLNQIGHSFMSSHSHHSLLLLPLLVHEVFDPTLLLLAQLNVGKQQFSCKLLGALILSLGGSRQRKVESRVLSMLVKKLNQQRREKPVEPTLMYVFDSSSTRLSFFKVL